MTIHVQSVMTMIVTEAHWLIQSVLFEYIWYIYNMFEGKEKVSLEPFCQTPSTEAVNIISVNRNRLSPAWEQSPLIPVFCSKYSLLWNHNLDQILFIPIQYGNSALLEIAKLLCLFDNSTYFPRDKWKINQYIQSYWN